MEYSVQFSSVAQSCSTLCDPMDCSTPGFPVHYQLPEPTQTRVRLIELVMPSNHLILCRPLLLLPSIPPSIRVFIYSIIIYLRCYQIYLFGYERYLKIYAISMKAIIINSAFQTKGKKFNFICLTLESTFFYEKYSLAKPWRKVA